MWRSSSKSLGETQHCFWKSDVGQSFFHPHVLAPKTLSPLRLGFQGEERKKWDLSVSFTFKSKLNFPTFIVQGRFFFLAFNQDFLPHLYSDLWRTVNMFSESCILLLTNEGFKSRVLGRQEQKKQAPEFHSVRSLFLNISCLNTFVGLEQSFFSPGKSKSMMIELHIYS